ncbi:MAG: bifunctional DNA-formamidopyrimidine glycosylase/DNA-(apurinic or apyrimidinic site) lyase [Desulfohalobiaceae bacterium]|nr:bifunctional DNA-formamidopyrimidine glycosylase/DNA-(apurinic or apyrimidinic site) lyase [Desulfohalobiaceae bacterium]MCF8086087.1 bifunctional DNA-formamidopyrimidine glycosylase/DNA-(apurinic or apyrimidinic site) lyase [Desulfohalobiaceae bacterium]
MPELPEVEIISRCLDRALAGARLQDVRVRHSGCLRCSDYELRAAVQGKRVDRVRRRAKLVLLELEDGALIAFHLKMTGRLLVTRQEDSELDKHTHLVFSLLDHQALLFRDVRKFGYCRVFASEAELRAWPFYAGLGPEPLELDAAEFVGLFQGRRGRIKPLLLDQTVLAGIGNIYADESLHLSGIHPETPADAIGYEGYVRLYTGLIRVLQQAIKAGGSTFSDFVDANGTAGSFQNDFLVYQRAGQPCTSCGSALERIVVTGRSSVYCPVCQQNPRAG